MDTNGNGRSRIDIELILTLFDTLKESNDNIGKAVEKQTDAIIKLSGFIKEGVQPEDLRKMIEDHHTHSGKHLDNIDTCTETVEKNTNNIENILTKINSRVKTMITVVIASFAVLMISFIVANFYVKATVEREIAEKLEAVINQDEDENLTHYELIQEIERIRKEIQKNKE